jgi:secreted trypsin-like serine protease
MTRLVFLFLGLVFPVTSRDINPFIVGGTPASIGDHPYHLSLRVAGSHSCSASLLSTTRAVSAAHCAGSAISLYSLLGGTVNRLETTCTTCVLWNPTAFIRHPSFVNNGAVGFPNDVAVLQFAPIATNVNLSPIVLSRPVDGDFAGQTCVITGWGRTTPTSGLSTVLLEANVTVLSNDVCTVDWSSGQINDGHVCISSPDAAPCGGDSAGPLNCSDLLAGIMSWGVSNCSPTSPTVYTRISYYYDWITAQ